MTAKMMRKPSSPGDRLLAAAAGLENRFDRLRAALRRRLGREQSVNIQAYRSFGAPGWLQVRGRVLAGDPLARREWPDTAWHNLLANYRRFESDEVPFAPLHLAHGGQQLELQADAEGYFDARLPWPGPPPQDSTWLKVAVRLREGPAAVHPVTAVAEVLVPGAQARFGIISDVDDTLLRTDTTSLLRMARVTFLQSAHSRLPFPGVAAFYRALQGERARNPLFFVSSSPWNLYDLLVDFCRLQDVPPAPFLLRDFGLEADRWIAGSHLEHKRAQAERIFATYPALDFVLVGDSGQHDPEIYAELATRHPGRVRAIYIRDVSVAARDAEVDRVAEDLSGSGVPLVRMADTAAAADDAAARGLIDQAQARAVRQAVQQPAA